MPKNILTDIHFFKKLRGVEMEVTSAGYRTKQQKDFWWKCKEKQPL